MNRETSALFSLQELSRMEEQRARSLAEAEARAREAAANAAREAEERAAAARHALEREQEAARRAVERAARDEAARREAMHQAVVEAARVRAEAETRAADEERRRVHERLVERSRQATRRDRLRAGAVGGLGGALLGGAIAAALYLGVAAPRAEAAALESRTTVDARDTAIAGLRSRVNDLQTRLDAATAELTTERDENASLRSAPAAAPHGPVHPRGPAPTALPPRRTNQTPDGFASCPPDSKDPLCAH